MKTHTLVILILVLLYTLFRLIKDESYVSLTNLTIPVMQDMVIQDIMMQDIVMQDIVMQDIVMQDKVKVIIEKPKERILRRCIMIELSDYHYEYIGIALEYLIRNRYDIIELYLPGKHISNNEEWITFFKNNYYKYEIKIVDTINGKYDYAFFTTMIYQNKIHVDANKFGGIIHNNDNESIKYMYDYSNSNIFDFFSISPLIKNTVILNTFGLRFNIKLNPLYENNFYSDIDYFMVGDINKLDLDALKNIFNKINKKCLFISKYRKDNFLVKTKKSIIDYFYESNVIELMDVHPNDLIKCFTYKKGIFIPKANDYNTSKSSRMIHLSVSFNTRLYLPTNIYNIYPMYHSFDFISYDSIPKLVELLTIQ